MRCSELGVCADDIVEIGISAAERRLHGVVNGYLQSKRSYAEAGIMLGWFMRKELWAGASAAGAVGETHSSPSILLEISLIGRKSLNQYSSIHVSLCHVPR